MTATSEANLQQAANWKNVNNWHWVERNCLPWAQSWIASSLTSIAACDIGKYSGVKITAARDISGDADLNVRKGKLRYLYDLSFKFDVVAELNGEKRECIVTVEEFTFDSQPKDFEYSFKSSDSAFADAVKKSLLPSSVFPLFDRFPEELVKQNSGDILVDAPAVVAASAPAAKSNAVATPDQRSETLEKPQKVTVSKCTMEENFKCSPEDLFTALTDVGRLNIWTRSQCQFGLQKDSPLSLYNGAITGKTISSENLKSLQLEWRNKSWPAGVVSTVTFTIVPKGDFVQLKLLQDGYPKSEEDNIKASWTGMVFDPIKHTFGYVY